MPKSFANTQDLVEVKDIKSDAVVLKNGALRQIVMVSGINFALKSEEEQNVIVHAYQDFLNGLDFQIQIVVHSRKINIDQYLETLKKHGEGETSPILQNQAAEYREFVRGFVEKNAIMEKTFLVTVPFVSVSASIPGAEGVGNIFSFLKKSKNEKADEEKKERESAIFEDGLGQLKQRTAKIIDGLLAIGLDAVTLNTEQLTQLFYNFYNPETIEKGKEGL